MERGSSRNQARYHAEEIQIKEEFTRESTAILGSLIGIHVVIIQALIGGIHARDLPAMISLLAFALPILRMLVILTSLYAKYRFASFPLYLTVAYILGEGGAALGMVAIFWYLS